MKSFARKGAAAKQQNSKDQKAQDASASGSDSRVKEQLSHSNRQLQAMANQVRALGAVPFSSSGQIRAAARRAAAATKAVAAATATNPIVVAIGPKEAIGQQRLRLRQVSPMQTRLKTNQKHLLLLQARRTYRTLHARSARRLGTTPTCVPRRPKAPLEGPRAAIAAARNQAARNRAAPSPRRKPKAHQKEVVSAISTNLGGLLTAGDQRNAQMATSAVSNMLGVRLSMTS